MQASPSPYRGDDISPSQGHPSAASPSSGSSPYWASASSASPVDAIAAPSAARAALPTAGAAPAQRLPPADMPLPDEETASSMAYEEQWASPAEVLELQSVCRELSLRYQTDMRAMQAELERTRRDRDACRRAAEETAPLKKAYTSSKAAYEAYKAGEHDWQEEREMMRLQLQRLSVDNQKLRLSLEKQKKKTHLAFSAALGGSRTTSAEDALWSAVAPQLSPAFGSGGDTQRRRPSYPTASPPSATPPYWASSASAGAAALSAKYGAAPLTPGSADDSKLAGRSTSGSGSLFADTPPRTAGGGSAAAAVAAASVAASAAAVGTERGSLMTPTASTSFPSDEALFSAGRSWPAQEPLRRGHASGETLPVDMAAVLATTTHNTSPHPSGRSTKTSSRASPPPAASLLDPRVQETTMPPVASAHTSRLSGGSQRHETVASLDSATAADGDAPVHEAGEAAAEDEDPSTRIGRGEPLSISALPTPSSSNDNADRRSASTNPIYAQGVSSSASTSMLPHYGAGDVHGARPLPARAFAGESTATPAQRGMGAPVTNLRGPSLGSWPDSLGLGSVTASTATSSASGLSLLYRLPRGPAEALEEQVKLVEMLNVLAQRNAELEARAQQVEALWSLSASQRDQRLLATTHEKEGALREAQHWSDAAASLETRASALDAQLEDSRAAFEDTQQELLETRDAMLALQTTHAREKEALRQDLEERHAAALKALKQTYEDTATAMTAAHASLAAEADRTHQTTAHAHEALSAELEETHAALGKATRALRASEEAAAAQARTTEAEQARARDQRDVLEVNLGKAIHDRAVMEAHAEALEGELAHLKALHRTREACLETMEARLEEACQSLAVNGSAEEGLALWRTRAQAAEAELETQRAFYERELRVRQTAMEAMQSTHQQESLRLAKKLEAACIRFDALKLKFATAAHDKGWLRDLTLETNQLEGKDGQNTSDKKKKKKKRTNDAEASTPSEEDASAPPPPVANSETAAPRSLPCDPVKLLQSSNATATQLCRSLHRPLS